MPIEYLDAPAAAAPSPTGRIEYLDAPVFEVLPFEVLPKVATAGDALPVADPEAQRMRLLQAQSAGSPWYQRWSDPKVALSKGAVGLAQAWEGARALLNSDPVLGNLPDPDVLFGDPREAQARRAAEQAQRAQNIAGNLQYLTGQQNLLEQDYSPQQQWANRQVAAAQGVLPTLGAYARNPSTIAMQGLESLPAMYVGGAIGRGAAPTLARWGASEAMVPVIGGAVGEGAVSGLQTAAQIQEGQGAQLLTPGQSALAVGSGALTAALSLVGGKIAERLKFVDPDTLLAGGHAGLGDRSLALRVIGGMISEGVLEELPQSVQEQLAQNIATGRPLWEGVPQAAIGGALVGGVMGAGSNLIGGWRNRGQSDPVAPVPTQDAGLRSQVSGLSAVPDPLDARLLAALGESETAVSGAEGNLAESRMLNADGSPALSDVNDQGIWAEAMSELRAEVAAPPTGGGLQSSVLSPQSSATPLVTLGDVMTPEQKARLEEFRNRRQQPLTGIKINLPDGRARYFERDEQGVWYYSQPDGQGGFARQNPVSDRARFDDQTRLVDELERRNVANANAATGGATDEVQTQTIAAPPPVETAEQRAARLAEAERIAAETAAQTAREVIRLDPRTDDERQQNAKVRGATSLLDWIRSKGGISLRRADGAAADRAGELRQILDKPDGNPVSQRVRRGLINQQGNPRNTLSALWESATERSMEGAVGGFAFADADAMLAAIESEYARAMAGEPPALYEQHDNDQVGAHLDAQAEAHYGQTPVVTLPVGEAWQRGEPTVNAARRNVYDAAERLWTIERHDDGTYTVRRGRNQAKMTPADAPVHPRLAADARIEVHEMGLAEAVSSQQSAVSGQGEAGSGQEAESRPLNAESLAPTGDAAEPTASDLPPVTDTDANDIPFMTDSELDAHPLLQYLGPDENRGPFQRHPDGTAHPNEAASEAAVAAVARRIDAFDARGQRLLHGIEAGSVARLGRHGAGAVAAVDALAQRFGLRVQWFVADPALANAPAGAQVGNSNLLLINAQARTAPALVILAHEAGHVLERANPQAWREFVKVLAQESDPILVRKWLAAYDARTKGPPTTPAEARREFVSEVLGWSAESPTFWQRLLERAPASVRQVVEKFLELTDQMLGTLNRGWTLRRRAAQTIDNLANVRRAAVSALEALQRQQSAISGQRSEGSDGIQADADGNVNLMRTNAGSPPDQLVRKFAQDIGDPSQLNAEQREIYNAIVDPQQDHAVLRATNGRPLYLAAGPRRRGALKMLAQAAMRELPGWVTPQDILQMGEVVRRGTPAVNLRDSSRLSYRWEPTPDLVLTVSTWRDASGGEEILGIHSNREGQPRPTGSALTGPRAQLREGNTPQGGDSVKLSRAEGAPGDTEHKYGRRWLDRTDTSAEARGLADITYDPRAMAETEAQAAAWLHDAGSFDNAYLKLRDAGTALDPDVRRAALESVRQRVGQEEATARAAGNAAHASELARLHNAVRQTIDDLNVGLGRAVNINKLAATDMTKWTPLDWVFEGQKMIEEARTKKLGDANAQELDAVHRELQDANAQAAPDVARQVARRKGTGGALWQRYQASIAGKVLAAVKQRVESRGANVERLRAPIEEFSQRLADALRSKIKETLGPQTSERTPAAKPDRLADMAAQLQDAARNPDRYAEAHATAAAAIRQRYANQPETLRALTGFLDAPEALPVDRQLLADVIAREVGTEVAIEHQYGPMPDVSTALTEKLSKLAGLNDAQAAPLAAEIQRAVAERTAKLKRQALARLTRVAPTRRAARSLGDRLLEASNIGALDTERYWELAAEKLGLPAWKPETAEEIRRQADALQQLPEGQEQQERVALLLGYIARQHGIKLGDLAEGAWYSSILSGIGTHKRNFLQTMANTWLFEPQAQIIANPDEAVQILLGLADGTRRGMTDALGVLKTGVVTGTRMLKAEMGHALELRANAAPWYDWSQAAKWPSRALSAEDMINFRAGEEMHSRQLAYRQAKTEGLRGAERRARVREILGNTPEARASAAQQAAAEGFTGWRRTRRTNEIIEQRRPKALTEEAADFGREVTFNQDPTGRMGNAAATIQYWTRNEKLGKTVAPFSKIAANVFNWWADYTPLGYKRAFYGQGGGAHATEAPTGAARRVALIKATEGTLLMTALLLTFLKHKDDEDPFLDITASGPSAPAAKAQLLAKGWKPYSIKIGDVRVSYESTPAMLALAPVGAQMDQMRYQHWEDKEFDRQLWKSLTAASGAVMSRTFLSGLRDLISDLGGGDGSAVSRFTMRLAGSVVPRIVQDVDRIWNPERSTANTISEQFTANVPVARQYLNPVMRDVFGQPVRYDNNPMSDYVQSTAADDPLWQTLANRSLYVPVVGFGTEVNDRPSTRAERYWLNQQSGAQIRQVLDQNRQWLQTADQKQAQKWISKVAKAAHEDAKARLEWNQQRAER